jgi:alanyl-tRNA synthetase
MLQKEAENFVIAAAFETAGKPQLLLMYSEDLVKAGHNAGADVREAAKLIMGGGGGQPGLATAGGKNTEGLADALAKLVESATK